MAKKDDQSKPDSIRLPGDPITEPREINLPLADAPAAKEPIAAAPQRDNDAAPVAAAPKPDAKPSEPVAAKKDSKPDADEPQGHGPHDSYGVEAPTSSSPDAWLKYDEDVLAAKDAYDAEQKKIAKAAKEKAATDADLAPKPAEETKPAAEGEYQPPPAREAAPTLAADEKFALEPGAEWTRGQIVGEIVTLRGIRDERDKALNLFGLDSYDALEKGWKPFIEAARANPGLVPFLDKQQDDFFMREADPEYASFMDENRARFLEWRKQNPGSSPPPARGAVADKSTAATDSEALRQVQALQAQIAQRDANERNRAELQRLGEQLKTERLGLWKTYPILEQQPELWRAIYDHAILSAQRQRDTTKRPATYTLTDAVRDKWSLIQQFLANAKAAPSADATPVPVRAGGQESSSVATASDDARERTFASSEDAAADWLKRYPNGYPG